MEIFVVGQRVLYVPKPVVVQEPEDEEETEAVQTCGEEGEKQQEISQDNGGGDIAIQTSTEANGIQSEIAKMNAVVICVHKDDYPNIYYTIQILETNAERQTVEQRLEPLESRDEAVARIADELRMKQEAEAVLLQQRRLDAELAAQQAAQEVYDTASKSKRQRGNEASGETTNPIFKPRKADKKDGKDKAGRSCVCS